MLAAPIGQQRPPDPNGNRMLLHRLRALVALAPAVALAGLLVASPGFAAQSIRITSPLSGTTVAGVFEVTGVAGGVSDGISVALATQTYGDCGAVALEQPADVDDSGGFAASIQSSAVADGVYCVIVTADGGRLSTAVGDVTVNNSASVGDSLAGTQLPTRPLDDPSAASTDARLASIANLQLLAPVVLGAAAMLALLVLVLALLQRRRAS
jgi:hypothetical protein